MCEALNITAWWVCPIMWWIISWLPTCYAETRISEVVFSNTDLHKCKLNLDPGTFITVTSFLLFSTMFSQESECASSLELPIDTL